MREHIYLPRFSPLFAVCLSGGGSLIFNSNEILKAEAYAKSQEWCQTYKHPVWG